MKKTFFCSSLIQTMLAATALMGAVACSRQPVHSPPAVQGQDVVVDASRLANDVPRFFTYRHDGRNISFFVIKMEDRKVASFLDACASCFTHKRGYKYDEDAIVTCRYCDMKFSIYKLEKGLGGCYPIKLEGRLENGTYFIPLKALQAAAGKF